MTLTLMPPAQLRWDEEDLLLMSKVLGPEQSTKRKAPLQDSIIRSAAERGVLLTKECQQELDWAWDRRIQAREIKHLEDVKYRHRMAAKLFAHQRVTMHFIETMGLPAYLFADQPGVGKTPPAILWAADAGPRRLIITPNTAKVQWRREIRRWVGKHEEIHLISGTKDAQRRIAQRDGWVIGHWESMVYAKTGLMAKPWDIVILDEAHAIQNRDAQRTQNVFELQSKFRLALTAHPYAKNPDQLWSILHFLYPEIYTSFWRFFGMHVKAVPKFFGGFEIEGTRRPKLLRWELEPFTLRRTRKQVRKSLPPLTRHVRTIELPPKMAAEYKRLCKEFFVKLQGAEKHLAIPGVLARTTRLRQYLVDPDLLGGTYPSIKYPIVREIMDELDGPPVIFTMFRQAAVRLQKFLGGEKRIGLISGGMTDTQLARTQDRFHTGRYDALVVVTQAGGTALNLGRYGYVIHLDLPWTARDLEQTEGRVDRPIEGTGEMVPTTAYAIVIAGTYEQKNAARLERRHHRFNEVFDHRELEALFAA